MIGILEIVLTVMAWRRGWRYWALAPIGMICVTAFFAGLAIGASGGSPQAALPLFLLLDLGGLGALSFMVARPARHSERKLIATAYEHVAAPTLGAAAN